MVGTNQQINGCGACGGFWKFFKPPHKKFFVEECNKHDEAYNIGGSKEQRKQADRDLYFSMIDKSINYYKSRKTISLWWFVTLSLMYYGAVRVFGSKSFNYKK